MKKTWSLNIFSIRRDIKKVEQAIDDLDSLSSIEIPLWDGDTPTSGMLYYKVIEPRQPDWVEFFSGVKGIAGIPRRNSVPALLMVLVDGKFFGVAFSWGSSLLKSGSFDPTFGLKVSLNSISRNEVRSYDKKSFDDQEVTVIHHFWVEILRCPFCETTVELHPHYQLAYDSRQKRQWVPLRRKRFQCSCGVTT